VLRRYTSVRVIRFPKNGSHPKRAGSACSSQHFLGLVARCRCSDEPEPTGGVVHAHMRRLNERAADRWDLFGFPSRDWCPVPLSIPDGTAKQKAPKANCRRQPAWKGERTHGRASERASEGSTAD
jgi:hypothetical protein